LEGITSFAISPDGKLVAASGYYGGMRLRGTNKKKVRLEALG